MRAEDATETAYKNGYNKGYADALGGGWVSVRDDKPKNPEERVQVLLSDKGFAKNIANLPEIDTDRYLNGRWVRWGRCVTHWMPLPLPPKGE